MQQMTATKRKGHPSPMKGKPMPPERKAKMAAARQAVRPPLELRFWMNVEKRGPDECWLWTGCTSKGYGAISVNGVTIGAHRVSLELAGIKLPATRYEAVVDHTCRNRACVNPAHMRFVLQAVNSIENSESPFARNKRKTHCKYGHEFTPENTRIVKSKNPRGAPTTSRVCLKCYGPGGIRKTKQVGTSRRTNVPGGQ
jgi:hypothetical protein